MGAQTIEPPESPLAATLETFFETKTARDLKGTMAYFSPNLVSYIDATLGWAFDGYQVLRGVFAAGDVRSGSIKRVASAVGEGSMAVRLVHDHLARQLV